MPIKNDSQITNIIRNCQADNNFLVTTLLLSQY